jgi:hypothetical protein
MTSESYKEKTFVVEDSDARIRDPNNLNTFFAHPDGTPRRIAPGTVIRVGDVKTIAAGSKSVNIFVHAMTSDAASEIGWTSAANLKGRLLSETIGVISPVQGASRFGSNAAWSNGQYLGQIVLIKIVGTNREIECIAEQTSESLLAMVDAARSDGCLIGLNSGFRSYPEQKHLSDGWQRRLPGFNPANLPGHSNHQSGVAFDIDVGAGPGNRVYDWLATNATQFGFVRTVKNEVWHWEYLPTKAEVARQNGRHEAY